ncbi:rab-GTPase-TBC domain-containing protein [Absidia repens]|uniref:Rab-GTPase-TBC domain-containing protein n=1 Tax=Absidia repens TaxID=90262 RepID=A0A1X2J064_9FUNG|nr:rab-GTPase-TBC domain-containing protein [Absidia repens]
MDEYVPRKSFWRRNGMKLPGSVRIVPSHTQQTDNQETSTPASLLSQPPSTSKSSPAATHNALTNDRGTTVSDVLSSSSSSFQPRNDHAQHKRHTSSTQQKSFNAFLKDTNDEWDDSIEDNKRPKAKSIPGSPSTIQSTTTTAIRNANSSTMATDFATSPVQAALPLPPLSLSSSSSAAYTSSSSLVPEPQQELIISKLTLADDQPSPQQLPTPTTQLYKKSTDVNGVIDNVKDVLKDPTLILNDIEPEKTLDPNRTKKMKEILCNANVDLVALRGICWSGIPPDFRLIAWQLLLGYLPCNSERRVETLARKRKEYLDSVKAAYARGTEGLDQALWHQIHIDILRTNPGVILYQSTITQECLERILYQWAIRHPASGYVQGINDLVMPIFEVFLSAYIDTDPEGYDMKKLNQDVLDVVEADSFWCLSKLLDGIQDNYTFAQPGIQRQIVTLKDLVSRIDARLANHLQQEGIEFIQFAFRWMNCLLMRELPLKSTIRMWDTYLAEGSSEGFSEFHVYVCAAFLVKWSAKLQKMDFQEIMIFLQQLPTEGWQEKDIELLLSEAYMWKTLFHNAPSHLKNK